MSLLLTPDNQVAGAVESSAATRSNAVGLVTSINDTTATVTLLNGLVLQGNPTAWARRPASTTASW